jgi:hypothetical protein
MAKPRLDHLERQFELAVDAALDTPRRVEVPQRMEAGSLAPPALLTTPAATWAGCQPWVMMAVSRSTPPRAVGKARPSSPLGQARRCSRSTETSLGGSGTVRREARVVLMVGAKGRPYTV